MNKKTTRSLARRINARLQWRALAGMLLTVLAAALAAVVLWCAYTELQYLPTLQLRTPRAFRLLDSGAVKSLYYCFGSSPETRVEAEGFAVLLILTLAVMLALRWLFWLGGWFSGVRRLRKDLQPIDSLASVARTVSGAEPDETLFRELADAIDQLNAASPSAELSLDGRSGEDIEALEAAVNSLIRRMRESYRQQIRFVDDASHELRTPIAVIQGYANLLDRWGKSDEKVLNESIAAIRTESEHMKTLVEQLLFLARGDMGRQSFSPEPVALDAMLRELRDESVLIDRDHRYELRLDETCTVSADPAMLKQAVRILIDNAAKYTSAGGDITLRLEKTADRAQISVQDSGCGISREDAEHVFERFYRSDKARAETDGSGLGLAIAKWIVDQHRGQLRLISYVGIGTRFTVILPLQA